MKYEHSFVLFILIARVVCEIKQITQFQISSRCAADENKFASHFCISTFYSKNRQTQTNVKTIKMKSLEITDVLCSNV